MNIAVCDNEPLVCQEIKQGLSASSINIDCQIFEYHSGKALLDSGINFDMVFLDIELKESLDGLEIAQLMKKQNPDLILIFISAYSKYVSSAFYLDTFHFLLKPIEPALLQQEFRRGLKKYQSLYSKFLISYNHEKVALDIKDIIYLESQKRKLFIKLTGENAYETYGKISSQEELCNMHGFIRIHRSYLVNPHFIARFERQNVILTTKEALPVSRKYHKAAKEKFLSYLLR